jgi:hypothetical protein
MADQMVFEHQLKLQTSAWAVSKAEELLQYLSDGDREYLISRLHGTAGAPQVVRETKKRGPRKDKAETKKPEKPEKK